MKWPITMKKSCHEFERLYLDTPPKAIFTHTGKGSGPPSSEGSTCEGQEVGPQGNRVNPSPQPEATETSWGPGPAPSLVWLQEAPGYTPQLHILAGSPGARSQGGAPPAGLKDSVRQPVSVQVWGAPPHPNRTQVTGACRHTRGNK